MANYCRKCGQPLEIDYNVCPNCGTRVKEEQERYQSNYVEDQQYDFLWAVLGFFVPLVGLILFLLWQNTKPMTAKYIGIGALVGFASRILLGFTTFSIFPFVFSVF